MLEKYVTIKGTGQAEVVEKKSRFIANVVPVHSEEEAMAEIESSEKNTMMPDTMYLLFR